MSTKLRKHSNSNHCCLIVHLFAVVFVLKYSIILFFCYLACSNIGVLRTSICEMSSLFATLTFQRDGLVFINEARSISLFVNRCMLLSLTALCIDISLTTAPPHLLLFTVLTPMNTTRPQKIIFFIVVLATVNTKLSIDIKVLTSLFDLVDLFFEAISFSFYL
jgi:hypothetical protein